MNPLRSLEDPRPLDLLQRQDPSGQIGDHRRQVPVASIHTHEEPGVASQLEVARWTPHLWPARRTHPRELTHQSEINQSVEGRERS